MLSAAGYPLNPHGRRGTVVIYAALAAYPYAVRVQVLPVEDVIRVLGLISAATTSFLLAQQELSAR